MRTVPIMSIVYFALAFFWLVGSIITFGEWIFWILVIMIPLNIFAGIKMLNNR